MYCAALGLIGVGLPCVVRTSAAAEAEAPAGVGEAADRYAARDPASLHVPRRAVTRRDYVELLRPMAAGFENGGDHGPYGPRHALPALAVFALEGDARLGEGIKKTLRHYGDWVRKEIETSGGVFSMEGATLLAFYQRELRRRGLISREDEDWFKQILLALRQYQCGWRPGDGLWRGSHHRSQCQGINHALAAAFYPGEPDAARWNDYAAKVWGDWWDFRDVGINDTGYFYSSFCNILKAAELLDRREVFTDAESRKLFDRVLFELTPDGVDVPYGASGGYNGSAGARIFVLELAARHTRDGRYRWGAHRLMNHGQARGFSSAHHHLQAINLEFVALASLVCDDTVEPVEPEPRSVLLQRKEIIRLSDAEARRMFPEAGGVDCNMYMTQKTMPHKLVLRAGWRPGDLFLMIECYARHDPLNPTAVLALERHSAAMAEMTSEKFVSRENAVHIDDVSGTASYLGRKPFPGEKKLPLGYAGMECTVPELTETDRIVHARVCVTNYMGYRATHQRDILMVKNRFVLLRDETEFDDAFRAAVGPAWNTQHVGQPRGEHWLNTWFSAHYFQAAKLYDVPPWDLLIWYAPKPEATLVVESAPIDTPFASRVVPTRYTWQGDVAPGSRVQFITLLLPHAPLGNAAPLAGAIRVLADEPGIAAVRIDEGPTPEIVVLNAPRRRLRLDDGSPDGWHTEARAAYLELGAGRPADEIR